MESGEISWYLEQLEAAYGIPPKRPKRDPLDSLMRTILSQNTSDVNRDIAYQSLKAKFPAWDQVKEAAPDTVAETIQSGGLANQKTARMQRVLRWLASEFGSLDLSWVCQEDPDKMIKLFTEIKGIGIKTIAVVLCFSCRQDVFPVDTHVNRICNRLGIVPRKSPPEKTFRVMNEIIPAGASQSFHLNMIRHGREVCKARTPKCADCILWSRCDYGKQEYDNT